MKSRRISQACAISAQLGFGLAENRRAQRILGRLLPCGRLIACSRSWLKSDRTTGLMRWRSQARLVEKRPVAQHPPVVPGERRPVVRVGRLKRHVPEVADVLRRIRGDGLVDDVLADLQVLVDVEVQQHQSRSGSRGCGTMPYVTTSSCGASRGPVSQTFLIAAGLRCGPSCVFSLAYSPSGSKTICPIRRLVGT